MKFADILKLALRNLREARLRAGLTTMGVVVGVAVIVTMVSFGLGLQRNAVQRFKDLDLFNEITVSGRSIDELLSTAMQRANDAGRADEERRRREERRREQRKTNRVIDDAALKEIAEVPGVESVEPSVSFVAYARANGRTQLESVGGALVPNAATRFKSFAAGRMLSSPEADEAVVDDTFLRAFGYKSPEDAVGQTLELLAPPGRGAGARQPENEAAGGGKADGGGDREDEEGADEQLSFFGLPLEGGPAGEAADANLAARPFRIVGVLKSEVEGGGPGGGRRFRGLMPVSAVYVPLPAARAWQRRQRSGVGEVALQLARQSGLLGEGQEEGYPSAVVRVSDPDVLPDVQKRIAERGFSVFSILDQLKEIRTVFLILNSALGLLGGISLLVASFGIANTMIMSILERTREIGIMKAIGAEDREIKLIFFVEAALIGLTGGVLGSLAAWAIDAVANRLAYNFILKPRGVSYVSFFALPPYLWLGAIAFAVLIAIVAALYPAARAARIDPVRALRHD